MPRCLDDNYGCKRKWNMQQSNFCGYLSLSLTTVTYIECTVAEKMYFDLNVSPLMTQN